MVGGSAMVGPMIQRIKRQRGHCWSELGNVLAGRSTYVGGGSFVRGGTYVGGEMKKHLSGNRSAATFCLCPRANQPEDCQGPTSWLVNRSRATTAGIKVSERVSEVERERGRERERQEPLVGTSS